MNICLKYPPGKTYHIGYCIKEAGIYNVLNDKPKPFHLFGNIQDEK